MRPLAVISDVHGNLEAFTAVLEELARLGIDRIFSLGDMIGYGPDPEACLKLSEEYCELRLMGNHEFAVIHPEMCQLSNPVAAQAIDWTRDKLEPTGLLSGLDLLSDHHQIDDWLFVHGSAREPLAEYVREKDPSGLSNFDAVVETLNNDFSTFRICFVGHNHKPFLGTEEGFIYPHDGGSEFNVEGGRLYVSVGSVGQPRDGDPRSCFVVFDGQRVVYYRVPYNVDRTVAKIRASGLPNYLADRLPWGR